MPTCQNCDAVVSKRYVMVFAPNGVEHPRVCPHCEDKVRDGGDVRPSRVRRQAN